MSIMPKKKKKKSHTHCYTYVHKYINIYIYIYIYTQELKKKKKKYNNNNDLVLYFLVSDVNPQQTNQGRPQIFYFVNFCVTYFIKIKYLS